MALGHWEEFVGGPLHLCPSQGNSGYLAGRGTFRGGFLSTIKQQLLFAAYLLALLKPFALYLICTGSAAQQGSPLKAQTFFHPQVCWQGSGACPVQTPELGPLLSWDPGTESPGCLAFGDHQVSTSGEGSLLLLYGPGRSYCPVGMTVREP